MPLDSVLIEQVLINLLDNAVKYTPPGSPITLSAWATEGAVTVEVADQGPGLPPGEEQRIFEKFYRVPRATQYQRCRIRADDLPRHRGSARRAHVG